MDPGPGAGHNTGQAAGGHGQEPDADAAAPAASRPVPETGLAALPFLGGEARQGATHPRAKAAATT